MRKGTSVSLLDLITCLSDAIDLVSPAVTNHHKRVAYIAFSIGKELGLSENQQQDLMMAAALHDGGALSLEERIDAMQFEVDFEAPNLRKHTEAGYLLLKTFKPFSGIATIVRCHHVPWDGGNGSEFKGQAVPMNSHILHLADRVSVLIRKEEEVLGQVQRITETVRKNSGKKFMPELVEAFMNLSGKECLWLDAISLSAGSILSRWGRLPTVELNTDGFLSLAGLFAHLIDFRSPFTATHSSGVSASAEFLARAAGLSEDECRMIKIAGYLHDLGKLAVPVTILEKPGKLTEQEFNVIKTHPFYSYRILEGIDALQTINAWASFHHERLDGNGYPFHHKDDDLPLGSRIMAVADVFTALTEDRAYRKAMAPDRALGIVEQMVEDRALDPDILSTLKLHFDEVVPIRSSVQETASRKYRELRQQLESNGVRS